MPARKLVVPEELLAGLFTREGALRAGLSRSALEDPAILRVAPRACLARAVPSLLDRVNAYALTLSDDVLVEGITALHLYGLGIGDIAVLGSARREAGTSVAEVSADGVPAPPRRTGAGS